MLDALRPPGFFEGGWKIQEASESLGTAFRAGPGVLLSQEGGVTFPFRPCVAEAEVYFVEAEVLQEAPRRGGGGLAPALYVVAGRRSRAGASGRRPCCSWRRFQPPGGELRPEGPVHLRQGQVPGPRLQVQCVQPAGVRGPGMQFILLQEVLPPLCPGEHGRLPSGNPARLGEKESSIKEAGQPAWLSDMSAA
ncbi:cysteine-rich DPF motif domain-containing protein 1 isoform X2 [Lutra lutra]|uniref:cysteine-rich DPF motif domain-containing protein 1 isoform X2 n=1 Tax=Lutra lutra TaxID=9657 RepID=UPI001FD572CE|nr:cysteine-rich DPF motif domain-containing protein 1 isoform X2 [Lutra lutra]